MHLISWYEPYAIEIASNFTCNSDLCVTLQVAKQSNALWPVYHFCCSLQFYLMHHCNLVEHSCQDLLTHTDGKWCTNALYHLIWTMQLRLPFIIYDANSSNALPPVYHFCNSLQCYLMYNVNLGEHLHQTFSNIQIANYQLRDHQLFTFTTV